VHLTHRHFGPSIFFDDAINFLSHFLHGRGEGSQIEECVGKCLMKIGGELLVAMSQLALTLAEV
jgi:hypothetical protein